MLHKLLEYQAIPIIIIAIRIIHGMIVHVIMAEKSGIEGESVQDIIF